MKKTFILVNIKSMNNLPVMERWLLQTHGPEAVARIGPWLTRYQSYRVVPPPPEMHPETQAYGYYNWRITELWSQNGYPQAGILPQEFFKGYKDILGLPDTDISVSPQWCGNKDRIQSIRLEIPARPTEDFLGGSIPANHYPSILRWIQVVQLPRGITPEQGDDWFLNTHAPEVLKQPGLMRFTSHKVIPSGNDWDWFRVSELWYEDFDAWRNAVIENPPEYTKPAWAEHDTYPFFKPYEQMGSTFILEAATNHWLPASDDYLIGV